MKTLFLFCCITSQVLAMDLINRTFLEQPVKVGLTINEDGIHETWVKIGSYEQSLQSTLFAYNLCERLLHQITTGQSSVLCWDRTAYASIEHYYAKLRFCLSFLPHQTGRDICPELIEAIKNKLYQAYRHGFLFQDKSMREFLSDQR